MWPSTCNVAVMIIIFLTSLMFNFSHAKILNAQDQGSSSRQVSITRQIRRDLMAQSKLSLKAKNITVVTTGNSVYLKGTVKNGREKSLIQKIALKNSRSAKVINKIKIQ